MRKQIIWVGTARPVLQISNVQSTSFHFTIWFEASSFLNIYKRVRNLCLR